MAGHRAIPADLGQDPGSRAPPSRPSLRRRGLLGGAGVALSTALAPAGTSPIAPAAAQPAASEPPTRPLDTALRRRAAEVREARARAVGELAVARHPTNDDEARYSTRIGNDTRALPHNERGEVDPAAWRALYDACQSGDPADFDRIPLGGVRKLGNPVGTMAVAMTGITPTQIAIPAPPALASAERAAEAVEVYWMALLRDVPFAEFHDGTENRELHAAAAELDRLAGNRGKVEARVTPGTLLRGTALYVDEGDPKGRAVRPPGVLDGPFVSQFLLRDVPCGAQWLDARIRAATPASEFLTDYGEWLRAQNGQAVSGRPQFDPTPRYIATGRDLAESVRQGVPLAPNVALLLLTPAGGPDPRYGGMFPISEPTLSPTNPYRRSPNQSAGNATFGGAHVLSLVNQGINLAGRGAYWQKWFLYRTLRPEAYGGLAHNRLANGATDYPLHDDALRSEALDRTRAKQDSYLLSQIAPEGAPLFPAYPGGGAAVAGVVATLMKALFDEGRVIANAVQPDPRDPTRLVPYAGPPLTVGGELNKMAMNWAFGRNWMGIHFWSDAAASLVIGEEIAIGMLRDERATYREAFDGFSFTRFDGTRVTI